MAKVAVLVDLSFFLKCYRRVIGKPGTAKHPPECVAASVWNTAVGHVDKRKDELYRILVYDCRPYDKKAHHPLSKKLIDFNKSDQAIFRNALLDQLKRKRKMALRLARCEGIDVVLDPLWNPISPDLHEHIDGLKSVWQKPAPSRNERG